MMKPGKINLPLVWLLFLFKGMLISACSLAQIKTSINDAWISEAPPMASVNAGYFLITNNNKHAIILTEVTSSQFGKVEMHHSVVENGLAKMIKQDPITIESGESLQFKPGGFHLMLFNAEKPYVAGDIIELNFNFSNTHSVSVEAPVKPLDQMDHSSHTKH